MNQTQYQSKDILLVDDTPANLKLLTQFLTSNSYNIRIATNGNLALESVNLKEPDLILLDIRMPGLDGYQVCQKLKENQQFKNIPVIFLSALDDGFDKAKAFELGGDDYISKPFQEIEVLARIENQLKIREFQSQLLLQNERLQKQNEDLELLNQDLEAFAYSISHDLSNPVCNIQLIVDLVKQKNYYSFNPAIQEYWDLIEECSQIMARIIKSLLALFQVKNSQLWLDRVNLTEIVSNILDRLQQQEQKRKFDLKIQSEIVVLGDGNLLKIALENLLFNAWKYTEKEPNPFIEFGQISKQESPEMFAKLISNQVSEHNLHQFNSIYFVKDNGIGFDLEKAENLFIPFQRLHKYSDYKGHGIGLSIVRRIIQRHHGLIWCDAQENIGATFYFTLPEPDSWSLEQI